MPNLNKVMLMGNLTRDPELRYTQNNTAVCNFSIAINRRWQDQQKQQQEETTFVDCEAWGRTAEVIHQYIHKGHPTYVEGRLKLDEWQDKEGNRRSKLKMVVEMCQFINDGGKQQSSAKREPGQQTMPHHTSQYPQQSRPHYEDENIPF